MGEQREEESNIVLHFLPVVKTAVFPLYCELLRGQMQELASSHLVCCSMIILCEQTHCLVQIQAHLFAQHISLG